MKIASAEFLRTAKFPKDYPQLRKPEVAFLGRSNVGKSSLINALLHRKSLARISSTPGRTRALNFFLINQRFLFVDPPGYGYAKVSRMEKKGWDQMVRTYFNDHPSRIVAVLILDARHEPTKRDLQMRDWLEFYGLPYLVVATKIDKVKKNQWKSREKALKKIFDDKVPLFFFSAMDSTGQKEVWRELRRNIEQIEASIDWEKSLSNPKP
jgi:GTP-binding protein